MKKPLYVGHRGYQNMVKILKKQFFWPRLNKHLVKYISKCLECQQVKVERQHLASLLQPFPILEWKHEVISLDFIIVFPLIKKNMIQLWL